MAGRCFTPNKTYPTRTVFLSRLKIQTPAPIKANHVAQKFPPNR
jgi:hypothetical protein